jgi:hypothetical protein
MAESTLVGSPATEEIFVRNSSGLIRELGLREMFIMNWAWTGNAFSVSLAFMISQALWAWVQPS